MKYSILLVLLSISLHTGTAQDFSQLQRSKISPDKLSRDLELLWQGVDQFHSGAYWYTSRDSIKTAFNQVRAQLTDSLTVLGFHRLIAPLVGLTREDHADIALPSEVRKAVLGRGALFPFSIVFLDRKMYCVWDGSVGDNDLRGLEIISISSRPPQDLALQMGQLFSSDGFIERVKYSDLSDLTFSYYHYLEFGHVPSFGIVYKDKDGMLDSLVVDAQPLKVIREQIQRRYPNEAEEEVEAPPVDFRILDDRTAYIAVHTFDTPDLRKDKRYSNYKQFLAISFKTIADAGIQRLIVDVSQNGGGNEGNENLLYSYLGENYRKYERVRVKTQLAVLDNGIDSPIRLRALPFFERWLHNQRMPDGSYERKPKAGHGLMAYKREPEYKFTGELFVKISPVTYSGGSEFANMVYTRNRATFIGEETGGGYFGNTSGYSSKLELPHSGIRIYLPALQFVMDVQGLPFGRGVIPHQQVIPDIETYLQGPEAVLNFILTTISKQ